MLILKGLTLDRSFAETEHSHITECGKMRSQKKKSGSKLPQSNSNFPQVILYQGNNKSQGKTCGELPITRERVSSGSSNRDANFSTSADNPLQGQVNDMGAKSRIGSASSTSDSNTAGRARCRLRRVTHVDCN